MYTISCTINCNRPIAHSATAKRLTMKKLLLFLTLLSISHLAHGSKASEQACDNLWDVMTGRNQESLQGMTAQKALEVCKQEDSSFTLDRFILETKSRKLGTLLSKSLEKKNLEQVKFIFKNIKEQTKIEIIAHQSTGGNNPLHLAAMNQNVEFLEEILNNIPKMSNMDLDILFSLKNNQNLNFIQVALKNENPAIAASLINHTNVPLSLINHLLDLYSTFFSPDQIQKIIEHQGCKPESLALIIHHLHTYKHIYENHYRSFSKEKKEEILNSILKHSTSNPDKMLEHLMSLNSYNACTWLLKTFPDYTFTDHLYLDKIMSYRWGEKPIELIETLIHRNITKISSTNYDALKKILNNNDAKQLQNKLTLYA
jgi:hypothetical protein